MNLDAVGLRIVHAIKLKVDFIIDFSFAPLENIDWILYHLIIYRKIRCNTGTGYYLHAE